MNGNTDKLNRFIEDFTPDTGFDYMYHIEYKRNGTLFYKEFEFDFEDELRKLKSGGLTYHKKYSSPERSESKIIVGAYCQLSEGLNGYYVYIITSDDKIAYIGKGKGNRYKTHLDGRSNCALLNRDYFQGSVLKAYCYKSGISTSDEALRLESALISSYIKENPDHGLYNIMKEVVYESLDVSNLIERCRPLESNKFNQQTNEE